MDLSVELRRAISDIEKIRQRPLLVYAANVLKEMPGRTSIDVSDHLPFCEMVDAVPAENKDLDMLIVTPGGSAQQVTQFVDAMRPRFENVSFIVPQMAMSAGTIWVLSGNEIFMDERAVIGPIDPQVPGKDGRLLPAQAVLSLLAEIQRVGDEAIKQKQNPPWAYVQVLRNIDSKEIGNAIALSKYSSELAAEYLEKHKYRDWTNHHDGRPVTTEERTSRAWEAATSLCAHGKWHLHSHGITREVAWNELKIRINHPEEIEGFHRAIRRLWALLYWIFENTEIAKMYVSSYSTLFRSQPPGN